MTRRHVTSVYSDTVSLYKHLRKIFEDLDDAANLLFAKDLDIGECIQRDGNPNLLDDSIGS